MRRDGQTDEQTETTKPAVAFRKFGNAAKNPTREGFEAILFKTCQEDGRLVVGVQIVTRRGLRNFFGDSYYYQVRNLVFTVPSVNTMINL